MNHRSDESIDQEEFTKLRVELYHTTRRLEEQTRMAKMAEFYQQVLEKFIDVISDRSASVENLAKIVGIKANIRRDFNELRTSIGEQESQRTIFGRIEKLNLELDVQEELLGLIGKTLGQLVKDYDEIKMKNQKISKEHANCGDFGSQASGQLQKLKKIEKEIEQKDGSILQLQKINQSLEQQLQKTKKKYEEDSKKLTFLEKEINKKDKEIQQNREIAETAQETSKQRQRVVDNCQKLLQIINVPQDDYLKYYFRSNGLQLEPQKQHKNKYSIVFDN